MSSLVKQTEVPLTVTLIKAVIHLMWEKQEQVLKIG